MTASPYSTFPLMEKIGVMRSMCACQPDTNVSLEMNVPQIFKDSLS